MGYFDSSRGAVICRSPHPAPRSPCALALRMWPYNQIPKPVWRLACTFSCGPATNPTVPNPGPEPCETARSIAVVIDTWSSRKPQIAQALQNPLVSVYLEGLCAQMVASNNSESVRSCPVRPSSSNDMVIGWRRMLSRHSPAFVDVCTHDVCKPKSEVEHHYCELHAFTQPTTGTAKTEPLNPKPLSPYM